MGAGGGSNYDMFEYKKKQVYPIHLSKEKKNNHMELLLIENQSSSHFVNIRQFIRFMYNKSKHKEKNHFS